MVTACPVIPARNGPCRCGIHVTWCLFQGWDCIPAVGGPWGSQLVQLPHLQVRKPETQRLQCSDFSGGPVVMIPCFHCRGVGSIPGQGTKIPNAKQYSQKKKKNCNPNLHGTEPGHKCKSSIGETPRTWFLAGPLSSFCTHSWAYIHSFLYTHTCTHTISTLVLCTLNK